MDTRNMLLTLAKAVALLAGIDNSQADRIKADQATIAGDETTIAADEAQIADLQAQLADREAKLAEANKLVADLKGQMCTAVFSADDHALIDGALALALNGIPESGNRIPDSGVAVETAGSDAEKEALQARVAELTLDLAEADALNEHLMDKLKASTPPEGAQAGQDGTTGALIADAGKAEGAEGTSNAESANLNVEGGASEGTAETISAGETASENTNAESAPVAEEASGDQAGS